MTGPNRIITFLGESRYGTIRDRLRPQVDAFARHGFTVEFVDMLQPDAPVPTGRDVAFYFCPQGWRPPALGSAPVLALFGDHPVYHIDRLTTLPKGAVAAFPTPLSAAFARRFFLHVAVACVPPAVDVAPPEADVDKDIDLLFVGSYWNHREYRPPKQAHELVQRHFKHAMAALKADPRADVFTPVMTEFITLAQQRNGAPGQAARVLSMGSGTCIAIDRCYRGWLRDTVIRDLSRANVHLIGEGWDHALRGVKGRFTFHGEQPYGEIARFYARSKLCLNIFPAYHDYHERIFDITAGGSLAMTQATPALRERFSFTDDIAPLDLNGHRLRTTVQDLLADRDRLADRADNARRIVGDSFSVDGRVDSFLGLAREQGWIN